MAFEIGIVVRSANKAKTAADAIALAAAARHADGPEAVRADALAAAATNVQPGAVMFSLVFGTRIPGHFQATRMADQPLR